LRGTSALYCRLKMQGASSACRFSLNEFSQLKRRENLRAEQEFGECWFAIVTRLDSCYQDGIVISQSQQGI
jgi:hypothetical protein